MKVKVAIIGCGLIGAQWDADADASKPSLTHANAFSRHPGSTVTAFCDHDPAKAAAAAARWGGTAYSDPAALFAEQAIDLAVVAASSAARWAVVAPALAAQVKVLVIEKPLAPTLGEAMRLAAAIESAGIRSVVNFSRHWDPSMVALREQIAAGEYGAVERLVGTYGKGVANNGSHMIDLAAFLCKARPQQARALGSPLDAGESDWCGGIDRAVDAQVSLVTPDGTPIELTMLGTDQRNFTCFELRLIGSKGIFDMALGGRRLARTPLQADPDYAGYTIPGTPQALPARALESLDRMADEALRLARGEIDAPSCDAATALRTAQTVEAINLSAREGGRWVALSALPQLNKPGEPS